MDRGFAIIAGVGARIARLLARIDVPDAPEDVAGCVIVANHTSLFDVFVGWTVLHHWGRPVRFLVRAHYVDLPVLGAVLRLAGAIPVRDPRAPGAGFAVATGALGRGDAVLVMPEGHLATPAERAHDGLGRFHNGVGKLLLDADVPVVVAWVDGAERVWPQDRRLPRVVRRSRRPAVTVRYRVVRIERTQGLDADGITGQVRTAMLDVGGRAGAAAQPSPSSESSWITSSGAATIR